MNPGLRELDDPRRQAQVLEAVRRAFGATPFPTALIDPGPLVLGHAAAAFPVQVKGSSLQTSFDGGATVAQSLSETSLFFDRGADTRAVTIRLRNLGDANGIYFGLENSVGSFFGVTAYRPVLYCPSLILEVVNAGTNFASVVTVTSTANGAKAILGGVLSLLKGGAGLADLQILVAAGQFRVLNAAGTKARLTVKEAGGVIALDPLEAKRFLASQATTNGAGSVTLTGWGTGPTALWTAGNDQGASLQVIAGTTPGANPTVKVAFIDGAWPNPPIVVVSRDDNQAPTTAYWRRSAVTVNDVTFEFVGTPVAGTTYGLSYITMGY